MKNIIFAAFLLFMFKTTFSQSKTTNQKGSTMQLDSLFSVTESYHKSKELQFSTKPIVDINSKLLIKLNTNEIISRLAEDKKSDPKMVAKANDLIEILKNQKDVLEFFNSYYEPVYKTDTIKEKRYVDYNIPDML